MRARRIEDRGPRKTRIPPSRVSRTTRVLMKTLKARRARRSLFHVASDRIAFDALCASLGRSAAMRRFEIRG